VYSETADTIDVCTFDGGTESRRRLPERTGHVFHGFVPGMTIGTRYGLRVNGPWDPANGLRHNVHKLLLDPYATAMEGQPDWGQNVFGHRFDDPSVMDESDDAAVMPKCIVTNPDFEWFDERPPGIALDDTVIYEAHVKGLTQLHPDVPEELRGTYAGVAHPAMIDHFTRLGVTAIELMPVHQFVQDSHLLEKGLTNYWGYNSIGFFAPHGAYSSSGDDGSQVNEFRNMVKTLHANGLEVILDVVYNHTAEGNHLGPMLSLRGIDNAAYYRLVDDDRASYFDTTGTGNSLNVGHPAALRLIMDSLRYWVSVMHVDGFRFDLATTLTRQDGSAELHSAFLTLAEQDPVLASVKLIAEPWDTAGYQLGGFPAAWSEWNGKFRDDVRDFWNGADNVLGTVSQRILGSPDVYEASRRSPLSSVNFVTAHDGFTLVDLTSYQQKHNAANGEDGNDGEDDNRSSNGGAEGPTDDPAVNARRRRQRRNFMATLLLSAGVPMILGGDEIGRTQGGNNNAYCQDNETSWFDWEHADEAMFQFTADLVRLRRENPALRPDWFRQAPDTGAPDTVVTVRSDGKPFSPGDWENPDARSVTFVLAHEGADTFALLLNSAANGVEFTIPDAPDQPWELVTSSDDEHSADRQITRLILGGDTFTLLRSAANTP
jgi:isoamylase